MFFSFSFSLASLSQSSTSLSVIHPPIIDQINLSFIPICFTPIFVIIDLTFCTQGMDLG